MAAPARLVGSGAALKPKEVPNLEVITVVAAWLRAVGS